MLKQRHFENVTGIDYSEGAVELSRLLLAKNGFSTTFSIVDLLGDIPEAIMGNFDLIIDKGTFDAICLGSCPDPLPLGCTSKTEYYVQMYLKAITGFAADGCTFIITSCNWTKAELIEMFQSALQYADEIVHPSMRFGGAHGQTVTSLVFKINKEA